MSGTKRSPSDAPAEVTSESGAMLDLLLDEAPHRPARIEGIVIGRLVAIDEDGRARVSWPGCEPEGAPAKVFCPLSPDHIGREVALTFELGDPERPMVMGALNTELSAAAKPSPQAVADGERLVFSAEREIELRCGDASIILTRGGKVIIRGAYVHTQSSGLHRILGAAVKIN